MEGNGAAAPPAVQHDAGDPPDPFGRRAPDFRADQRPARVAVAASEPITRAGLMRALADHFSLVGSVDTVADAERVLATLKPALCVSVLDPDLRDAGLGEACARILAAHPAVGGVVLMHHPTQAAVRAAVLHGARAVFDLSLSPDHLRQVLRDVERGAMRIAPALAPHVPDQPAYGGATPTAVGAWIIGGERLTDRERNALSLIAQGYTSKKIAGMVGVSVKAVDMAVERATRRLHAAHRAHAVAIAVRDGLVSPW